MSHQPYIISDYLQSALNPDSVKLFMKTAPSFVQQFNFEAIAFRGMSGALLAPILAYKTGKTLLMVRKPKQEDAPQHMDHSMYRVEGDRATKRYLILDDFMCSGNTIWSIVQEIRGWAPDARCIGVLFYADLLARGIPLSLRTHFPTCPADCEDYMLGLDRGETNLNEEELCKIIPL